MAPRSVRSVCDYRSEATLVGHWMHDQNFIISSFSVLRKARLLVPAAFAVVSTHQSLLGLRGELWPVLRTYDPLGRSVSQQWDH
jgi:hypothetical protein